MFACSEGLLGFSQLLYPAENLQGEKDTHHSLFSIGNVLQQSVGIFFESDKILLYERIYSDNKSLIKNSYYFSAYNIG